MQFSQTCQECGKQAQFMCGQCQMAAYCSSIHQKEHWKIHKQHCPILNSYRLRLEEQELNVTRIQLRKRYFDSFMHKVFDNCIKTAQELIALETEHINSTREIFNELEYGISICLLCRSWLNVKNQAKAVIIIEGYLEDKQHFLKDMRDIVSFQLLHKREKKFMITRKLNQQSAVQFNSSGTQKKNPQDVIEDFNNGLKLTSEFITIQNNLKHTHSIIKQFSIKKVSLLAAVANILFALKHPVIPMYEMYTHHIQKMFGKDSYEASNCYFMVGSYYLEINSYYKAIACFFRAAQKRGNIAGDCYYNLGIIYQLLGKSKVALMMFENAAKLREGQFSENSSEVADVYHNIALIHQNLGNFKGAIQNLEKTALIYSKDKKSDEYKSTKESIKVLEEVFRKHMEKQALGTNASIFKDLKKTIRKTSKLPEDQMTDRSMRSDKDGENREKTSQNNYLRLPDKVLKKLNPAEMMHLSQLQEQLSLCQTYFMAATIVGESQFINKLHPSKFDQLKKENEHLFKHIYLQKLSKRGAKDTKDA